MDQERWRTGRRYLPTGGREREASPRLLLEDGEAGGIGCGGGGETEEIDGGGKRREQQREGVGMGGGREVVGTQHLAAVEGQEEGGDLCARLGQTNHEAVGSGIGED